MKRAPLLVALAACGAPQVMPEVALSTPVPSLTPPPPQRAVLQGQALESDRKAVASLLEDDARQRGAALVHFAANAELARSLHAASESEARVPEESRTQGEAALRLVNQTIPAKLAFDAVFAVDRLGRVVAHLGYDGMREVDDFELGGYAVVADALHGHLRDDTLVLERVHRVVARPVEHQPGSAPAGAVLGARTIDDAFVRDLSHRIGSALAFFDARGVLASAAPESMDRSDLWVLVGDLGSLPDDPDHRRSGVSGVRQVGAGLGAVYARLPGESWLLGVGFAVIRPLE